MKRSGLKYQIEQGLNEKNWEIVKTDSNNEWWDDENWLIQFKYDREVSLFVCFIVDPQFERPRKQGQEIWIVKASTQLPKDWNDNQSTITTISLSTRKFEKKLKEFIAELEKFKKEKTTANKT